MNRKLNVEVMLCGGLGNQLFQYAFGRSLALRNGGRVILDDGTFFKRDYRYRRSFELGGFMLPDDISKARFPATIQLLRFRLLRALYKRSRAELSTRRYIEEEKPGIYDSRFRNLDLRRSVMTMGYWQCPLYFADFDQQIRSDLSFKHPLNESYRPKSEKIESSLSVGVHVRRKDFQRRLSIGYYKEAMRRMKEELESPQFFVFTDDREWWTRQAGVQECVELVSNESATGFEDFQLLSTCKHFIIANSSFSFWAAWLGKDRNKRVIAPSKDIWVNSWDIVPKEWVSIPVERESGNFGKLDTCNYNPVNLDTDSRGA